jgi:hypothetical protein
MTSILLGLALTGAKIWVRSCFRSQRGQPFTADALQLLGVNEYPPSEAHNLYPTCASVFSQSPVRNSAESCGGFLHRVENRHFFLHGELSFDLEGISVRE